jgi:hypothetical protein
MSFLCIMRNVHSCICVSHRESSMLSPYSISVWTCRMVSSVHLRDGVVSEIISEDGTLIVLPSAHTSMSQHPQRQEYSFFHHTSRVTVTSLFTCVPVHLVCFLSFVDDLIATSMMLKRRY